MQTATFLALTKAGLVGWAVDKRNPSAHKQYIAMVNGHAAGQGRNDGVHDLPLNGHPDHEQMQQFGFLIPIARPAALEFPVFIGLADAAGQPAEASLVIESAHGLAEDGLYYKDSVYEGLIDGFFNGGIGGWAWNPCNPDQKVIVRIDLAGEIVTTVVAGDFRPDLAQAGKGSGHCSYFAALPPYALRRHAEITVSIVGTEVQLPKNSQDLFTLPDVISDEPGLPGPPEAAIPPASEATARLRGLTDDVLKLSLEQRSLLGEVASLSRRIEQQELYRTALQGTVDNLVRAWLEQRDQIRALQAHHPAADRAPADVPAPVPVAPAPLSVHAVVVTPKPPMPATPPPGAATEAAGLVVQPALRGRRPAAKKTAH